MPREKTLLTQVDLLTIAALSLDQVFTVEALAVKGWTLWPHLFCIKGFVEYPDNNRAIVSITHQRNGCLGKMHMIRMGQGEYSLTQKGRKYAESLYQLMQEGKTIVRQPKATIEVDVEAP